jgi:hypothetical protein
VRSALSFFLLLISMACFAGPYSDLQKKLEGVSDAEAIRLVKADSTVSKQPDIRNNLDRSDFDDASLAETLRSQVQLRAMAEEREAASNKHSEQAKTIKQSPFYSDQGVDRKKNWLADSLDRLKNIRLNLQPKTTASTGTGILGGVFVTLIWCLLAAGVIALIYFAVRHIQWQGKLTRKAKTLLEEDEPDRTLDEWLQLADEHAAAGRFRQAVRALYLACLLKFDEADVARFDRGETNWEHLARIEESEKLPADIDFRTPTKRFDTIWYGHQTNGMPDVELFRAWYQGITESLKKVPA